MLSKVILVLFVGCWVLRTEAVNPNKFGFSDDLLQLGESLEKSLENGIDKSNADSILREIWPALTSVPEFAKAQSLLKEFEGTLQAAKTNKNKNVADPDIYRTTPAIVRNKGYSCEEHVVQTEDGYLLTIFRVFKSATRGKRPILLSHGLADTSFSWILSNGSYSLGYLLADANYDVWLGNSRGNINSAHIELTEDDLEYWDFSFDQQGQYDVPATIDYILSVTGDTKVAIVGHDQGAAQTFSAVQQLPSLADKISIFVLLAPTGSFASLTNTLTSLLAFLHIPELLERRSPKFVNISDEIAAVLPIGCELVPTAIESLLGLFLGSNPGEIDLDRLGVACAHSLGWTSTHNIVHWGQLIRGAKFPWNGFRFFDYGYAGNRRVYGEWGFPPVIDISRWPSTVPTAVFYGGNDEFATPRDVEKIISLLPSRSLVFQKKIDAYAHLDFTWGKTAVTQVYNETISLIQRYH